MDDSCDVNAVHDGGRVSGYRLEEHIAREGGRYRSRFKEDIQYMLVKVGSSTDHDHGPARVSNNEIMGFAC